MKTTVRLIPSELTFDLRDRVLRGVRPRESSFYAEDNLETTFHVGVLTAESGNAPAEHVISNGTFMQQGHPKLPGAALPYRLRGMATDPDFQKQGLGQKIVQAGIEELQKRGADLLWFNARVSAEGFYRKLGFEVIDDVYDIPQVGPHKLMYRWLR